MTKDFLLEIGLEEMPAHVVTPSEDQFATRVSDYLKKNKLSHGKIDKFSTPRRLTLLIHDVAEKQPDVDIEAKGPSKKIAQDKDGNWSKAAQGFTRGQGLTPDDIFFKELKGTEYAYVKKHINGKPAADVLAGLIEPIKEMNFPTRMKWNVYHFEYIRPIHWIVAMFDDQIIPMKLLNVESGNKTQGHRFLGHEITLSHADDYEAALNKEFVIVDAKKRKQIIRDQIAKIASDNNWDIDLDSNLLEEVNNLVEYPNAFAGSFDKKYLEIPEEVLITSMKDNQRYFYVRNQDGSLAPYFIGVRNGNTDYMDNVIKGNEKVLVARLEDAAFFFQEDQKHDIDYYTDKLKNVSFHDKIGSMSEKMERTGIVAQLIADKFGLSDQDKKDLARAAKIYKFDLVTNMVGEFSELQGVMGEKYAEIFGEDNAVSKSISESYMPTSADGQLPETTVGSVLSLAEKIESIMSFFAVDLIPTGSNDPYGLRRQAMGVVRILDEMNWHIDFDQLQQEVVDAYDQQLGTVKFDYLKHESDFDEFIVDRVKQLLNQQKFDHDIVDAVAANKTIDPLLMNESANVLTEHKSDPDYKESIEALTRVLRITKKSKLSKDADLTVNTDLFQDDSEKFLYNAVNDVTKSYNDENLDKKYQSLISLKQPIADYFDKNMIMDKDENVKNNRLKQLEQIAKLTKSFGDLNQLIVK